MNKTNRRQGCVGLFEIKKLLEVLHDVFGTTKIAKFQML